MLIFFRWVVWLPVVIVCSNLLRFSIQHDPILDPKLAPISLSFALLFQITFPSRFPTSFWSDFGPQIDVKIDQKSIKKFFQNQSTNQCYFQLHLQSNFEDNIMFKQNGRFSKIVPKPNVFVGFLDIRSCEPKQTRDMQRIEKSPKTMSKNQLFFYRNSVHFRYFWHRFPSPKFKRLGEGLGLDFGLDFRPCWGPKRRPNGFKNSSRKIMPT